MGAELPREDKRLRPFVQEEDGNEDYVDYDNLMLAIHEAPMTWMPQILSEAIAESKRKGVFAEGGMERFIERKIQEFS